MPSPTTHPSGAKYGRRLDASPIFYIRHIPKKQPDEQTAINDEGGCCMKVSNSGSIKGTKLEVLVVHMDACLLPIEQVSEKHGLHSEIYRNPIVTVTITVVPTDLSKTATLHNLAIDWGQLTVLNQVPKNLPHSIHQGTIVVHAFLARTSPILTMVKLTATLDGKSVEYRTEVEDDVPYLSNPLILGEALQILQEQLKDDAVLKRKERESGGNFSIDTGYSTSNQVKGIRLSRAMRMMDKTIITNIVSENEEFEYIDQNNAQTMKRKDTPAYRTRPRCHGRRLSRLSRFGRMSRMSRRRSRSSLTGASDSSLVANPPGSIKEMQSRMSRRKRDRARSEMSQLEYRMRPGEMSDLESSAPESDRMASNWSESSCGLDRRGSMDLRPLSLKADKDWTSISNDSSQSNSRNTSQNRPEQTPESPRHCTSCDSPGSKKNSESIFVNPNIPKPKVKRERRPTPIAIHWTKQNKKIRQFASIITEETNTGNETESDGSVSDLARAVSISMSNNMPDNMRISALRISRRGTPGSPLHHLESTLFEAESEDECNEKDELSECAEVEPDMELLKLSVVDLNTSPSTSNLKSRHLEETDLSKI